MRLLLLLLAIAVALPANAESRVPASSAEISLSFVPVVKSTAPAVVNIYARRVVAQRQRSAFADNPFFRDFFRDLARPQPRFQNSLGSGVIVSSDGLVVSNYHVVGEATDIRVVLTDRREFSARVVLADEESDLAVLQLEDAEGLDALDLRDSDSVEVGELVLAVGNPFGVGQTVSSGIVSGLARSGARIGNARGYFIQTDAAINPGNSGGALVDIRGRLIGINTSILSRSGGSNGIGFAIPANLVAQVVNQARAGKTRFERPWAGISAQAVDQGLAEGLGMAVPEGIILSELHPESPFRSAGLQAGDVILAVDGLPLTSAPEMMYRMGVKGIGGKVLLEVLRGGEMLKANVDLVAAPETPAREVVMLPEDSVFAGLVVANINPAVQQEARFEIAADQGVIVLQATGLPARAGLRQGDVIRTINGREIRRSTEVTPALQAAGRSFAIELERGGTRTLLRFRI